MRGLLGVEDRVRLVEHLEEPVDGGAGVEGHREQEADRLDREAQHRRRREEREQLPDGQLAVRGEPARRRAGRARTRRRAPAAARARVPAIARAFSISVPRSSSACPSELLERVLAAAEGLEHADAVHRLLDGGREVALLVLRAPGDDRVPLLEDEAVDPERDRADQEEQAELPRSS